MTGSGGALTRYLHAVLLLVALVATWQPAVTACGLRECPRPLL